MVATLVKEQNAQVEWRPFYLRPDTPPEGMELPESVRARAVQSHARLKQMANAYGMEMVFATRLPNTRIAHEATEYARQKGKQLDFHHAVFDKFYGQGQDISMWDVLQAAAVQVGLDAHEMRREVEAGKYTSTVNALVQEAYDIGVTGVPTYVLNDRLAIVGAQPYEVFLRALERLQLERGEGS